MPLLENVSRDIKILIVDDFATMRQMVKRSLKQLGFQNVVEAEDGADALIKLQHEKFDFIVSDWQMPNMTGIELLKAVRAGEKLKDIPFLMVTGEATRNNMDEANRAGVSQYVVKPLTMRVLEQKLADIFKPA